VSARAPCNKGIGAYDKAVKLPGWLLRCGLELVQRVGPKGLEYGRFSIDSHFTARALGAPPTTGEKADQQHTAFAKKIISATAFHSA